VNSALRIGRLAAHGANGADGIVHFGFGDAHRHAVWEEGSLMRGEPLGCTPATLHSTGSGA
jgi:hypothetical protein